MRTKTEQELFWQGEFGDAYTERNRTPSAGRLPFFRRILGLTEEVRSACELGANRGDNLVAIRELEPAIALTGVELNSRAAAVLQRRLEDAQVVLSSIQELSLEQRFDLVFTCGVLIHIPPEDLPIVYDRLVNLSSRYVLVNEYFNPRPVEVAYRGHRDRLFKRDFAGELIDKYQNLKVLDYGFLWHRMEPGWDDTTWVLMEKVPALAA
jgi:pseudaminic acid biosynthesis-associated methylase